MSPGHREQHELDADHVGPGDPIGQQRPHIVRRIAPEQQAAEPHDAEMARDQQRNTQSEDQLGDFDDRVAKMPALIERPEPEQKCVVAAA